VEKAEQPLWAILFGLWIFLLIPWLLIAPLSAMAFDAGNTFDAWVVFLSIVSYPVPVIIASFMRRKKPTLLLLPFLNFFVFLLYVAGATIFGFLHNPTH
jgi:ABC-type microcin C transport system permease subunit YejB